MPIFVMAVGALVIFLAMGLLLFGATVAERRQRKKIKSVGSETVQSSEKPKARAAHA